MDAEIKNNLENLKSALNQSILNIKSQLELIDVNSSYIWLTVAVAAMGALIGFISNIVIYWIPSSMVLIYLWALLPIRDLATRRRQQNEGRSQTNITPGQINFGFAWLFNNLRPIIIAVSIVFIANLVILFLIFIGKITPEKDFNMWIPLLASIFYIPVPFFLNVLSNDVERGQFRIPRNRDDIMKHSCLALAAILLLSIVYILSLLVLPALSINEMNFMFYNNGYISWENLSLLVIVLVVQIVFIIFLSSYFSANNVKKELANSLVFMTSIMTQMNNSILKNTINNELLDSFKNQYYRAQKYDLEINNQFIIANMYFLRMNTTYLNQL